MPKCSLVETKTKNMKTDYSVYVFIELNFFLSILEKFKYKYLFWNPF